MSQQKVDRYKKQKNNREKIQRREKWELRLEKLAIAVVCIAMVGWIGYSAYDLVTREDPDAGARGKPQRQAEDRAEKQDRP